MMDRNFANDLPAQPQAVLKLAAVSAECLVRTGNEMSGICMKHF